MFAKRFIEGDALGEGVNGKRDMSETDI